jgi:hypothetical protein
MVQSAKGMAHRVKSTSFEERTYGPKGTLCLINTLFYIIKCEIPLFCARRK